jgi:hypothetical protein
MRLPPRMFVGWLAVILVTYFDGSASRCAQAQSLVLDHPLQDGQLISYSDSSGVENDVFTNDNTGLPNGPGTNSYSIPVQQSAPYDSIRLLAPNFDDQDHVAEAVSISTSYEITLNGIRAGEMQRAYRHMPIRKHSVHDGDLSREPTEEYESPQPERYHWRGLLAQSLFFNAIESSFRIASDDQIRYLLATKPFWHDYFASMKQFNMGRWNDGDEFLVNYIGHPMQGSVSSYIEIQNDPVGRQQEISATRAYWMSRFKGFLWSTVYSTHSEISPLGEAGIGNEGGWTYPIADCHRPCPTFKPGKTHYTNNTGWVDFIITPTVGTLWVFAEDAVDRYISDRIQRDDRSHILPKIIRGSLNPSRTMANFIRFKKPWYRDFQEGDPSWQPGRGIHMLPSDEERAQNQILQRFSFSAHYRTAPLGTPSHGCALCNDGRGAGFEADYTITPWISASVSLDKQHGSLVKGSPTTGSTLSAGFGVRLVHERPHNTFSLSVRPGFVYDQIPVPAHVDTVHRTYVAGGQLSILRPAATILLANDYKLNRTVALRSSFGATIVRYRTTPRDPPYIGEVPYLSWLSPDSYTNRATWIWQGGPVFRF